MRTPLATLSLVAVLALPGLMLGSHATTLAAEAPSVLDTRPESNLIIGTAYPQISAHFTAGASSIDPASIRLTVDDVDVTNAATVTNAYVSYVPTAAMSGGRHTASVAGAARDGTSFSEAWSFRVDPGMSASDLNPIIGYAPGPYGYPGYGYYPPGFSLFAPGPIFIVAGDFVQVVFFSPFFPYGNGFVTIGGIPGQFFLTPWYGCPGYFWANIPVPFGAYSRNAILSAHFTTPGGRTVIVHSTAPLQIDGTRRALPGSLRYANEPIIVRHPLTPLQLVKFQRVAPAIPAVAVAHAISNAGVAHAISPAPVVQPFGNAAARIQIPPSATSIQIPPSATRIQIPPTQMRIYNPYVRAGNDDWNGSRGGWMTMPAMPHMPVAPHPNPGGGNQH